MIMQPVSVYRVPLEESEGKWDYRVVVRYHGRTRSELVSGGAPVVDSVITRLLHELREACYVGK